MHDVFECWDEEVMDFVVTGGGLQLDPLYYQEVYQWRL